MALLAQSLAEEMRTRTGSHPNQVNLRVRVETKYVYAMARSAASQFQKERPRRCRPCVRCPQSARRTFSNISEFYWRINLQTLAGYWSRAIILSRPFAERAGAGSFRQKSNWQYPWESCPGDLKEHGRLL